MVELKNSKAPNPKKNNNSTENKKNEKKVVVKAEKKVDNKQTKTDNKSVKVEKKVEKKNEKVEKKVEKKNEKVEKVEKKVEKKNEKVEKKVEKKNEKVDKKVKSEKKDKEQKVENKNNISKDSKKGNKKDSKKPNDISKTESKEFISTEERVKILKGPQYIEAETLFKSKTQEYLKTFGKHSSKDDLLKESIIKTGTGKDKVLAIQLLIQKAPMYRLPLLDQLLAIAAKKNERDRELAIDALKHIFIKSLLPDNKLKLFHERGDEVKDATQDLLVQWYFEELLKSRYHGFIRLLEILAKDNLPRTRLTAINAIQMLLLKKPEQEEVLLGMLVNKLGDEDSTNSVRVTKLLSNILEAHPGMRAVIMKEINAFLHRPNNSQKAQYRAIYFLNQLQVKLDSDQNSTDSEKSDFSVKFMEVYFSFFSFIIKSKVGNNPNAPSRSNDSCISLLLFGIKKAYSYCKDTYKLDNPQIEDLFRITRKGEINKTIKVLCFIYEIIQSNKEFRERYYHTLYKTLESYEVLSQFDQTSLLNLIYKSIKNDKNISRGKAMLKRLLQFAIYQRESFLSSCLILFNELIVSVDEQYGELIEGSTTENTKEYDITYYDAANCNVENSKLWELNYFGIHCLPSISTLANQMLNGEKVKRNLNPSGTHTLHNFLDKFIKKAPKSSTKLESKLNIKKSQFEDDEDQDDEDKEEEESLNLGFVDTFHGLDGKKVRKSKSKNEEFFLEDEDLDEELGTTGKNIVDEDEEIDYDQLSDYSYEDLNEEDFEEDDLASLTKSDRSNKKDKKPSNEDDDEFDDDEDDDDFEEDIEGEIQEEDDDNLEDDDEDEMDEDDKVLMDDSSKKKGGKKFDIPDFGDEEMLDGDEELNDDELTNLINENDDEDDFFSGDSDNDDELTKKFKNSRKNDSFMSADDFEKMLSTSGSSQKQYAKKSKSTKPSPFNNKRKRSTK